MGREVLWRGRRGEGGRDEEMMRQRQKGDVEKKRNKRGISWHLGVGPRSRLRSLSLAHGTLFPMT